jgi:hypothetical protein
LSSQATRKDSDNRIKLLKDQLTVFSSDEAQLNKLVDWLEGVNQDLLSFVITPSQSWEVLKLYFISPNVDEAKKWDIFKDVEFQYPGIKAELVKNTCTTLLADANKM